MAFDFNAPMAVDPSMAQQPTQFAPGGLQAPNPPPVKGGGGMFGNMSDPARLAISAGLAGLVSRTNPGLAQSMMAPVMMQRQMAMQMAHLQAQNQYEYARQLSLEQAKAQLRLQYPDGEFAQELLQGGIQPGTPEWTQAMHTRAQNSLDPVVITPQGPMLRSQIVGAPPPPAPVGKLTPIDGGPTPQASGGFRP